MTIYERIKELRLKKGMSQLELAKLVGYEGSAAISKVEKGQRNITQTMIKKYATVLNTTPQYLLYGEESSSPAVAKELNEEDLRLLEIIKCLSPEQKKSAIDFLQAMISRR